jgi:threonine dehydrogenase-like Zn-dependent dehydrogenase
MKIAMLHGPRDLRIDEEDLETTNLADNEVWVKTEISALKIGTDRGNYEGAEHVPGAPQDYPRWVGDSNLGVVNGVGSKVTRFRVGDRVVSRKFHQSEYVAEEAGPANLIKVPEGVDSEDAVWSHLYALSFHCYSKGMFTPGENVAVVGLGVLGLGAVAVGAQIGARVIGLGNSQVRLDMARKMGAHACFMSDDPDLTSKLDEFTDGVGIDLVILTANPWPAFRTSLEVVRDGGRVSIVSLQGRGEEKLDFNPLPMELFFIKGISLISISSAQGYLYPGSEPRFGGDRQCRYVLSLMADGKLAPSQLITHRLKYTEMAQAYEMAYRREKNMLGVIFDWRE